MLSILLMMCHQYISCTCADTCFNKFTCGSNLAGRRSAMLATLTGEDTGSSWKGKLGEVTAVTVEIQPFTYFPTCCKFETLLHLSFAANFG